MKGEIVVAFGILSTYPPAQCGLATFSESLRHHLIANDADCDVGVVQVRDESEPDDHRRKEVVATLDPASGDPVRAVEALNRFDAMIVQHEYGIYGPRDGEGVIKVLNAVTRPVAVVLHTVLTKPSDHQRQVLDQIMDRADRVVVLSRTAARRLTTVHGIPPEDITVIQHGAHIPPPGPRHLSPALRRAPLPTVLTWGLIGRSKGIEWAIDAVAELRAMGVEARYRVVGQTHPKVVEYEGEVYRDSLKRRARERDVDDLVEFVAEYENQGRLRSIIADANVVLLPYESKEQVTSGVLIEAVAARKPVVATAFPHAVELLGAGAGLVVPHRDSLAMARSLRRVLTVPGVAAEMSARAGHIAPDLDWSAVADRYRELLEDLVGPKARLAA